MQKLFILNLIFFAPLNSMNRLSRRVSKPTFFRAFSSIKDKPYLLFGLSNWQRKYNQEQLKKIYSTLKEIHFNCKEKSAEIDKAYTLIQRHQFLVHNAEMYENYVISDQELKEIIDNLKTYYKN